MSKKPFTAPESIISFHVQTTKVPAGTGGFYHLTAILFSFIATYSDLIISAARGSPIFRPDLEFEIPCTPTAITLTALTYPSSRCLLMLGAIAIIVRDETISLKQHIWNRNISESVSN